MDTRFSMCTRIRHYRIWIYAFNIFIMILCLTFIMVSHYVLSDQRLLYFFETWTNDFALIYAYIGPAVQFVVSFLGISATLANRPVLVQMYWYSAGALLISDTGVGVAWVPRFKMFHAVMPGKLLDYIRNPPDDRFCHLWNRVQEDLHCCGVNSYKDWFSLSSFCEEPLFNHRRLPHSCCVFESKFCNVSTNIPASGPNSPENDGCMEPLLKWMHSRADILFMLGYCTLFATKLVALIILKREIRELLREIYHEREPSSRRMSDFIGIPNNEQEFIHVRKVHHGVVDV